MRLFAAASLAFTVVHAWPLLRLQRLYQSTGSLRVSRRRSRISGVLLPTYQCPRSSLERRPCTPVEVRRVVMTSPIKSCSLDPVPTFLILVREIIDLPLPYITRMAYATLADGLLSDSEKHVIVSPLLNKSGLDVSDMANYRPSGVKPDVCFQGDRTNCGQAVERIPIRQRPLAALSVSLPEEAFYRNGHATRLVGHTDSRRQTPGHFAWPS